jgi:murein DD-endopeptidase MepM/ murein hydrolase activator NlpD
MRRRADRAFGPILAASVGFLAGALFTGILLTTGPGSAASGTRLGDDCGEAALARSPDRPDRQTIAVPVPVPRPSAAAAESTPPKIGADPIADLRGRQLAIPVRGVEYDDLRSSFDEKRGASRLHEAMDILAPRHTPVLAVEDGTIARLFASQAGGTTIYQYDPSSRYVYYYAHLQRYAPGLAEGGRVKRGDVIGFVGTTGNAPENTPHLHFAIFRMTDQKQWWQGTPIDPYDILGGERK